MQSTHHPIHHNPFLFLPPLPHSNPHPHHIPPPQDTRTQLFVNNLPFRVRWQDLKDLFRKAGTVLRADVSLTAENRSKGFGTVLFANRMDAFKAVEIYNGFTWQTRILDVRLDQQDPTGALGMAAAGAPNSIPPLQQQQKQHQHQQQQHHHLQQQQQQQQHQLHQHPQQHPHPLLPPHLNNGSHHSPQNQHPPPPPHALLQFPSSVDPRTRINLNQPTADNGIPGEGNTTTGTHIDLHRSPSIQSQQPQSIHSAPPPARPASVNTHGSVPSNFNLSSATLPTRRLSSNPELPNSSSNKPVQNFQRHQHSQSLIPFSSNFPDQNPNLPQSALNSSHRPSSHRPSRSVQLFTHHVTPPGSTSTANSSHPSSSHGLDVHQPEFKPASSSLTHALSQLEISTYSATSSVPSLVISSAAPNSSAPTESQSSVGPHSSQVSVTDHQAPPSFHHYGGPPPHPHHIMPNAAQRGPYPPNPSLSSRLLFVGNLPFNFQWQDLKDLFRQAGNILRADVATTPDGRSRGFGTVLFASAEDASKAQEMYEGYELKGRTLKVHFDQFIHPSTSDSGGDNTWNDPTTHGVATNYYSMHQSQQPNHLSIPAPVQHSEVDKQQSSFIHDPANSNHVLKPPYLTNRSNSTDQHSTEKHDDQRSDLWAPEPVISGSRPSVPSIIPPPLSPIASRRSSYLKSNNPSEYTMANSEIQSNKAGNGPEPIGHPSNLTRLQTVPMPPPYDLKGVSAGMMSPAIPKVIQMTPSMPAFSFQAFMPATPPLLPQFFSPGIGPPSTPPYGRGGGTPPPAMKSINSPLGGGSIFPTEAEQTGSDDAHMVQSIVEDEHQDEEEQVDDESTKKTLDSNVDWGYQSSTLLNNRRASLFVGGAGGIAGSGHLFNNNNYSHQQDSSGESSTTTLNTKLNQRNGFSGRRLLGVGEEMADDRFNESYNRRASFDVSSLLNKHHPSNAKSVKTRPKNILISGKKEQEEESNMDLLDHINHKQLCNDTSKSTLINHHSDRLDLVGLGFVESIWAKKN